MQASGSPKCVTDGLEQTWITKAPVGKKHNWLIQTNSSEQYPGSCISDKLGLVIYYLWNEYKCALPLIEVIANITCHAVYWGQLIMVAIGLMF